MYLKLDDKTGSKAGLSYCLVIQTILQELYCVLWVEPHSCREVVFQLHVTPVILSTLQRCSPIKSENTAQETQVPNAQRSWEETSVELREVGREDTNLNGIAKISCSTFPFFFAFRKGYLSCSIIV